MTISAAMHFHKGNGSPRKIEDAAIPKIGIKSANGETVAVVYLARSQPQIAKQKIVLAHDCHRTPVQVCQFKF